MKSRLTTARSAQRGVSFLESLAALTVLALTLGTVAPSMSALRDRRHLEGAAAQLATDVRLARSQAVAHGASVRLSLATGSTGTCYIVHTGPAADCRCSEGATGPEAVCGGRATLLRAGTFAADGPLALSSSSGSMLFDANRGTVTPTGTWRMQLRGGPAIHQVVNIMGRARACSPAGAMPGYPVC